MISLSQHARLEAIARGDPPVPVFHAVEPAEQVLDALAAAVIDLADRVRVLEDRPAVVVTLKKGPNAAPGGPGGP